MKAVSRHSMKQVAGLHAFCSRASAINTCLLSRIDDPNLGHMTQIRVSLQHAYALSLSFSLALSLLCSATHVCVAAVAAMLQQLQQLHLPCAWTDGTRKTEVWPRWSWVWFPFWLLHSEILVFLDAIREHKYFSNGKESTLVPVKQARCHLEA